MKRHVVDWFREAPAFDLLLAVGFSVLSPLSLIGGRELHWAFYDALLGMAYWTIAGLRVDLKRAKRIPENTVLVSTPLEPSADAREFARNISQHRQALMNEGMTGVEATKFLSEILAAHARGDQS